MAKKIEGGNGVAMEIKSGRGKKDEHAAKVFEFKKPGTDVPVTAESEGGLKNRVKSGVKMDGLGTRLRFLNEFLAKQKEKYPLSTKQTVNQFLRRMIVENPEMIFTRYIDIFLKFEASVTNMRLSDFVFEVGYLRENIMKVKSAVESNPMFKESAHPLHDFLKVMEKLVHAAKLLMSMDQKEREEVMSGAGDGKLNPKQKAFLKYKHFLVNRKERHFKLAKKKEKEMKHLDHGVEEALAKIEAEERLVEKMEEEVAEAKVSKFSKKGAHGGGAAKFRKAA